MESNKDEAFRCLGIARKHRDAGNIPSARKFCLKSIALFETPEAVTLLTSINAMSSSESTSTATDSGKSARQRHAHETTKTAPRPNGTAGGAGGEKREYTPEQGAVVKRVRSCKVTEYYEILAVQRDCDESDIKKAYRKVSCPVIFTSSDPAQLSRSQLALALHPDKNGAPGADEAFKRMILSASGSIND